VQYGQERSLCWNPVQSTTRSRFLGRDHGFVLGHAIAETDQCKGRADTSGGRLENGLMTPSVTARPDTLLQKHDKPEQVRFHAGPAGEAWNRTAS
jgi:hypothetical protein